MTSALAEQLDEQIRCAIDYPWLLDERSGRPHESHHLLYRRNPIELAYVRLDDGQYVDQSFPRCLAGFSGGNLASNFASERTNPP